MTHSKGLTTEKKMALWAIIPVGLANAILTFIFFFIAIGSISHVFGWALGTALSVIISAGLGVGFVIGEALIHWDETEGWENKIMTYVILVLLAAINWGAGYYRAQDNITNNRVNAVEEAAKDPRYMSLLEEKQHLERNVLNDGKVGNDEMAIARQTAISAEIGKIVDEYRQESNGAKEGMTAIIILSLSFITVNIVFGKSVKYLRKQMRPATATDDATATKAQPAKGRNVAPKRDDRPPQPSPQPQPAIGYHAQPQQQPGNNKERILELYDNGYGNITEIAGKVGCKRQYASKVINTYRKRKK